jgi:hypothetical protein
MLSGGYASFEYAQCGGGTVRLFTPPKTATNVDWVLVLEVD